MPDSYGKRQRNAKKARKLAEREERRLARKQQRADPEGRVLPDGAPGEGSDAAPDGEAVEGSDEVAGAGTEAEPEGAPQDDA